MTADTTPRPPTPLRVSSFPHAHPYVDAVRTDPEVVRVPPRGSGGPSPIADEVADLCDVDVLDLHFGYERHPVSDLADLVADARARGVVVAVTVHDLDNPHLDDQSPHRAALDVLVPAADVVTTLSHHAREAIADRWGVDADVAPHPVLATTPLRRRHRIGTRPGRAVGVHLKSLRTNVLADAAVTALDGLLRDDRRARVVVRHHHDVAVPSALARRLADVDGRSRGAVLVHDRLTHADLERWLARLDVLLLPYAHGTHSGLLDLALDLGTAVVAPQVGAYAEQGAATTFPVTGDVARHMRTALSRAVALPRQRSRDLDTRRAADDAARVAWIATARAARRPTALGTTS